MLKTSSSYIFHNCNCSSALEYFLTTLVQQRSIGNFSLSTIVNFFHSFKNHLNIDKSQIKRTMNLVAWWSDIKTVSWCCIVICWSNDPHLCGRGGAGLVTIQWLSHSQDDNDIFVCLQSQEPSTTLARVVQLQPVVIRHSCEHHHSSGEKLLRTQF